MWALVATCAGCAAPGSDTGTQRGSSGPDTASGVTLGSGASNPTIESAAPRVTPDKPPAAGPPRAAATVRSGDALALSLDGKRLYVADEDGRAILVLDTTAGLALASRVARPGCAPDETTCLGSVAALIALDGFVLASVRDPGRVVLYRESPAGLEEVTRVAVTPDAWGLALSPDERSLLVTSPYHRTLSALDLPSLALRFSVELPAEPRAVVIPQGGDHAFVTHLRGTTLSRIDGIGGSEPKVSSIELDPQAASERRTGSLAYAATLSPDGERLFVGRSYAGLLTTPMVDVLDLRATPPNVLSRPRNFWHMRPAYATARSLRYLAKRDALLVASEGSDELIELDARAPAPAALALRRYDLGGRRGELTTSRCAAPSGLALSADETRAYVFCRASPAIAIVDLDSAPRRLNEVEGTVVELPPTAGLTSEAAAGRRLYFDARDTGMSRWGACAGCHPDGRWDGQLWVTDTSWSERVSPPPPPRPASDEEAKSSFPARKVPAKSRILTGRVFREGFVGMHAEARDLEHHITLAFDHHWGGRASLPRARALASYLLTALAAPARIARPLSAEEARGEELFRAKGCAGCHVPEHAYTNAAVVPIAPLPALEGLQVHPKAGELRVPSLLHVKEAGPYFHDASVPDLDAALSLHTERLNWPSLAADERSALVAFLKTLGAVDPSAPAPEAAPVITSEVAWGMPRHAATPPPQSAAAGELTSVPESTSAAPTADEWEAAPRLALAHTPPFCETRRLREWLLFRCHYLDRMEIERIVEPPGSVTDNITPEGSAFLQGPGKSERMDIVFPMRRGDEHVFAVGRIVAFGKYGNWAAEGGVFSEMWPRDAAAPTVRIQVEADGLQGLVLADLVHWND